MRTRPSFILFAALLATNTFYANPLKPLRAVKTAEQALKVSRRVAAQTQPLQGVARLRTPAFAPVTARKLLQLTPGWKPALSVHFTPKELSLVEEALLKTDEIVFPSEQSRSVISVQNWDYTEIFQLNLTDLFSREKMAFSEKQFKRLFGGTGIKGAVLANHFKLLSLESWLLAHGGEYPRRQFSVSGRVLKPAELTPAQREEKQLADNIKWVLQKNKTPQDPVVRLLQARQEQGLRKKTPEDWLAELQTWLLMNGEYPRSTFSLNGVKISPENYTPEQKAEAALANGINNAITLAKDQKDPVIADLIALKEQGRRQNTPAETLADLQAWQAAHGGRVPRSNIVRDGRLLLVSEMTPAEAEEKRLASKARAWFTKTNHPGQSAITEIRRIFQQASRRKSPEECVVLLQKWLAEHDGRLPRRAPFKGEEITPELAEENALARSVQNVLSRSKIVPIPQAEALQKLWQSGEARVMRRTPEEWLEAFKTYLSEYKRRPAKGDPEYSGVRNLLYRSAKNPDGSYQNSVVQQIYELEQLSRAAERGDAEWKEVVSGKGAETELKRFWRKATAQDRAVLQAYADELENLRDDFSDWLKEASAEHWLVMSSKAYEALETVKRGLDDWYDERADEADDILLWLSDIWWGKDEKAGIFSRVLYVGKNPSAPRLKDFRELQEITGIPFTTLPRMPRTISANTRLIEEDEKRVTELHLHRGLQPEEFHRAVESLLPSAGEYRVRMGLHELDISLSTWEVGKKFFQGRFHLHAEAQVPGEPVVVNLTLQIDASELAAGKSFAEKKRLYYKLFKPYLSEDALKILR